MGQSHLVTEDSRGYPRAASDYHVDVDWTGEWVAWSMRWMSNPPVASAKLQSKRLNDPLPIEPDLITFKGELHRLHR